MAGRKLNVNELRRIVADLIDEDSESIEEEVNLFTLGLDSITLMRLVGHWRQSGIEINFAELADDPTINAWWKLISGRAPAAVVDDRFDISLDVETDPNNDSDFPLAIMQHAYWIGRRNDQQLGGVASHLYTEFDGKGIDPSRLRTAIERLIERHDMLRARFTKDGKQRIESISGWRGLIVHDMQDFDNDRLIVRLESIRKTLSHQMLDIEQGEVFSTELSLLPEGRARLHLDVDMVAADAVSYRILLTDLARFYEQPDINFPAVEYSYRKYRLAHSKSRLESARRAAERWRDRLHDLPGAPQLPLLRGLDARESTGPVRVTRRHFMLSAPDYAALTEASRQRGLTPAMVVATAYAEVVGAWSAQLRFLLNVPLFDRNQVHPHVDKLIGDFTSSVLLTVDLTESVAFVERARRVQYQMHADAAHVDYSGVEVLRDLSRHNGQQVFAPVVFTSALNLGELFDEEVRRNFGEPVWIISQNPQVILDAQITEMRGGLMVNWDVREEEFNNGVADGMFAAFKGLMHRLAENGSIWDAPIDDLLPAYQRKVRELVNNTARPFSDRLLHEGFFTTSNQTPTTPALFWGKCMVLSYGELADRALRVAGALREQGIQPGDSVGVILPKGPGQVIAVLGILALGGIYVPVGVDQPVQRRARIMRTAGVGVVIDEAMLSVAQFATALDAPVARSPDELAYVIFTSGSTGEPKGVEVTHRAAMNTINDINSRYLIGPGDRLLAVSALDFDLSVYDIFGLLNVGGAVVCINEDQRRDALTWIELIAQYKVTIWNTVPQLLDILLTAVTSARTVASLRVVLVSGDWVGLGLSARLAAVTGGCRLVALGGATEAAIWSNAIDVPPEIPCWWNSVPYGFPLANQCFRVVDVHGRDCPDWVSGELWIGGAGVASGYRCDPERTADRFVIHAGQRWYRTGDQGRYWPDGTLEFLGRRDTQLKIRGNRIELGEIEAVLETHPQISRAIVIPFSAPGTTLIAAVTTSPGRNEQVVATPEWNSALDRIFLPPKNCDQISSFSGDMEAELVEGMLVHLLTRRCVITDDPQSVEVLAASFGITDIHFPIFRFCLSWLAERQLLTIDESKVVTGPRWSVVARPGRWPRLVKEAAGTPLAAVATRLAERIDDLINILCGELDLLTLWEDPVLAPDALMDGLLSVTVALSEIAASLEDLAHSLDRPLRIVELSARTGRTSARLLDKLPPDYIDYTVTDASARLLALARQRLMSQPHQLRFHRLTGDVVPENLHRNFDVLIFNNSHYVFEQISSGLDLAAELLAPNGVLLALEQRVLSPIAMISAVLSTQGFNTLDNFRQRRCAPLMSSDEWCLRLAEHGFERPQTWHSDTSPLVQLRACRATGSVAIRTAEVRDWLAEWLPEHMIPNRFAVLPSLPLNTNDKVDRTRVRFLLEHDVEAESGHSNPARGQVEEIVATTWAELLEISAVSRTDNFFTLGGDSMLLLKAQTLLTQRLRCEVAIVDLYRYPTVASLANHFGAVAEESSALDLATERARRQRRNMRARATGAPGRETNHRA